MPLRGSEQTSAQLTSNEIEAANWAEATALLIRTGYRVYRPEADCYGEDLVLRTPEGDLLPVQLKSRPTVDSKRYGGDRRICMLFPDPEKAANMREWFLVGHDALYDWVNARNGHTTGWKDAWSYPTVSRDLRAFLDPYCLRW